MIFRLLRVGPAWVALIMGAAVVRAGGPNNLNPTDSLCLDIRGAGAGNAADTCSAVDAECPNDTHCVDNDFDPLNGGVCVNAACFAIDETVVVDLELGPTSLPACGAQFQIEWDLASLAFVDFETDPDGDLGWDLILAQDIDLDSGVVTSALGIPTGQACDDSHGALEGGTIARLTLSATGMCGSFGVRFSGEGQSTAVASQNGALPITGCNGEVFGGGDAFGTVGIQINETPPVWVCPESSTGEADDSSGVRTVLFDPISVSDICGEIVTPIVDLCTVEYFPACVVASECGGSPCVDGFCESPVIPFGVDLEALLDGGGTFFPGRTEIRCSVTNDCGITSVCEADIVNDGTTQLVVDIEIEGLVGIPNAGPVTRCIEFRLEDCDGGVPDFFVSRDVVFGPPANIPGRGTASLSVPLANWTCMTALDRRHSLQATCPVTLGSDDEYSASFTGTPFVDPLCHKLIQGNVDENEHIDIVDFTILAGFYLTFVGPDTPCDVGILHADFNGDGVITAADFSFIVANFFDTSTPNCSTLCAAESAAQNPPRAQSGSESPPNPRN